MPASRPGTELADESSSARPVARPSSLGMLLPAMVFTRPMSNWSMVTERVSARPAEEPPSSRSCWFSWRARSWFTRTRLSL